MRDLRWAFRNLAARRWRVVLSIALLALALGANTLVFSAADSLVFARAPYRDLDRLVEIPQRDARTGRIGSTSLTPALLEEWRRQTDLFQGVEGYLTKVIFISGAAEPEMVQAADVTVGLIDLLGWKPRWGRSFVEADAHAGDAEPVLIGEALARARFGDPAAAPGQRLQTTAAPLVVVGVMPREFRYPGGTQQIWRALDPRGPLAYGYGGISAIARLSPRVGLDALAPAIESRSRDIGKFAGAPAGYAATPIRLRSAEAVAGQRRMLFVLVGAALCVLLIACANVACLELAGAIARARTCAIQLAVGASRATLLRTALIEGLVIVVAAAISAWVLATVAVQGLAAYVPPGILAGSANPIDVDRRTLAFMSAIGAAAWLLATLPIVSFAWRADVLQLLRIEGSSSASSRGGAAIRRGLTVAQVGLTVLLLASSVLYARSYLSLMALEKGFDTSGVASILLRIPPQQLGTAWDRHVKAQAILEHLRSRPGVVAAFAGAPPPWTGDSPATIRQIEIDDRPPAESDLAFPRLRVEPAYFRTLQIPLLAGRMFQPGESPNNVIISRALASRLWPGEDAVGHRFRESPDRPWFTVIGIVGHVRLIEDGTAGPDRVHQLYFARQPPTPPAVGAPSAPAPRFALPSYGFLQFTARVDDRASAADLLHAVRAIDRHSILTLEFVDDLYARQFADRLLATRIVGVFGVVAFVLAAAGIYGLMAYLVAIRAREMGIRIALGADGRALKRLVLGASLRMAALGAAIGVGATVAVSRWTQSQMFGVSATDPLTLIAVSVGVLCVAAVATWAPARQAARVSPRELLQS